MFLYTWASLIAQLGKNPPAMKETPVWFLGWEDSLEKRDWLPTPVFLGFPSGLDGKECARNVGDQGSIPRLERSPGGGNGNPLEYSCLENPCGRRSLHPWGRKELDTTERISIAQTHTHTHTHTCTYLKCIESYRLFFDWVTFTFTFFRFGFFILTMITSDSNDTPFHSVCLIFLSFNWHQLSNDDK